MIARVRTDDGRFYDVQMDWSPLCHNGRVSYAWWMREIKGEPRPARHEVWPIYEAALRFAQAAMKHEEEEP